MIRKPSDKEEEHFAELEAKRRKEAEEKKKKAEQAAERQRIKELHFMHCPKCGMKLEEITYHDIKIDRCMECHGVWLDHGELDEITRYQEIGLFKSLFSFASGKKTAGD